MLSIASPASLARSRTLDVTMGITLQTASSERQTNSTETSQSADTELLHYCFEHSIQFAPSFDYKIGTERTRWILQYQQRRNAR